MRLVSIVVPVFHNAPSLPDLLGELQRLAGRNGGESFEFIFVDDGSRDDSLEVLCRLAESESRMRVVKLSRNFGSTAAILAGMHHARGDACGVLAADLQDPPAVLDEMLARWREGRKVVVAARESRDDPWFTRLMASVFYALFRRFALANMPSGGFDFFLLDRQVYELISRLEESNTYLAGLVLWTGFDPAVVLYHRQERPGRYGVSMWTFAKKLKYFADSFVAFSYFPVRAASCLGILTSIFGLLYMLLVLADRLFWGTKVEGWASLMVVLLLVSGAQLLMTGILGEYLWRNLDETRQRPRFVVDRVVEGSGPSQGTGV